MSELMDRWEIRLLVEHYASAADRADGAAASELFTDDGEFLMWLDPNVEDPTSHRRGHEEIAAAIDRIRDYSHTHHTIGSHAVLELHDNHAHGETRCEAHHLVGAPPNVNDHVMFAFYRDDYVKQDGRWRFRRRELRVNWISILPVGS
ncbi:MAG TPA: SgcJ/EcaC family oxidoreductase [Mycobacteriales bacterium]|nr:SgcJ/EcaC family oxidoreductase [Mycobacteriales bacterium]